MKKTYMFIDYFFNNNNNKNERKQNHNQHLLKYKSLNVSKGGTNINFNNNDDVIFDLNKLYSFHFFLINS